MQQFTIDDISLKEENCIKLIASLDENSTQWSENFYGKIDSETFDGFKISE